MTGTGERLDTSRVSRWERQEEQPSTPYQDALCRVYRTNAVELGLSTDYSTGHRQRVAVDVVATAPAAVVVPRQRPDHNDTITPEPDSTPPAIERAEEVRRRVDEALSASTVSDATIDYKAAVAQQYGRIYKSVPVTTFLPDILADLEDVHVLTDRKLPSSQRQELCAVTARLAGLVSMVMVNIAGTGKPRMGPHRPAGRRRSWRSCAARLGRHPWCRRQSAPGRPARRRGCRPRSRSAHAP